MDRVVFRFFISWYVCGVILVGFDLLPTWLEWANAVFLIAAGLLGGIYFFRQYGTLGWLFSIGVVASTIFVEWLGTEFGFLFGAYEYNPDFGLFLFGVPFTIGAAWLMVMATTHALVKPIAFMVSRSGLQVVVYVVGGAFAAVVMDLLIDPVAANLQEYWVWESEGFYYGVPFSNFVGWFLIAFVLHALLYALLRMSRQWHVNADRYWQPRIVLLYVLMISMFMVIAAAGGIFGASALTGVLTVGILLLYAKAQGESS
ncbi:carotenoid biosynthesis protein [Shouchella shacheensis]|uniref:carotenoid biosynthesis protein n=1 Tax=Shouchella shacheensis TaxID=1649580 RepID=UPI0007402073|nr:carotenoid biosynthesis protein [Shouchella shacheensis]